MVRHVLEADDRVDHGNNGTGTVVWAPLTGGGSQVLTLQIPNPFAVAVDATTLYVSSGPRLYAIPKGH
jgi:hypothetical protein